MYFCCGYFSSPPCVKLTHQGTMKAELIGKCTDARGQSCIHANALWWVHPAKQRLLAPNDWLLCNQARELPWLFGRRG